MMPWRWVVTLLLLVPVGCFDEGEEVAETDGPSGTGGTAMPTSDSGGTPVTGTPDTGGGTTTLDPDGGPTDTTNSVDTTAAVTETETGTESTGPGPACDGDRECDPDFFCIDGRCQTCDGADDPDAACADKDTALPFCDAGTCVACTSDICDGQQPLCDPAVGCLSCTEHEHCPDSACHLMGPEQGACFDTADVVEISDITEFEDALSTLGSGASLVLNMTPETFTIVGTESINGEVAILGQPGTVITGGATNALTVNGAGRYLYFSGVEMNTGPFRGIRCDAPAGLWIDDSRISGYQLGILSGCETHVRRSHLTSDGPGTALEMNAASLFMENTSVGPGAATGVMITGGAADVRYTTFAVEDTALNCMDDPAGDVRNSIITSSAFSAVTFGCGMSFVDNAVTGDGFGDNIGLYDETWFVAPGTGDLHLSPLGQAEFVDIADWDDGDPLVDIDGDPRPQAAPGFPGLDEVP